MKWKNSKKILLSTIAILAGMSIFSNPKTVKADTSAWESSSYNTFFERFNDFGKPRIRYNAVYFDDAYTVWGEQGTGLYGHLDGSGYADGRWLYAIHVYNVGSGNYANMGSIAVKGHIHNYGWTNACIDGVSGHDYKPGEGWIEAIQLAGTDELGKYAYIDYKAICNPVSEAEVRRCSNGTFDAEAWTEGYGWAIDATGNYRQFFGNSIGAVYEHADYTHFNMSVQGNWAGTAGYSMPMYGFAATMKDYPCNVYVNPNGGQWAGATSTVQVGAVGAESAVRAGDAMTFRTDALPARAGYEFAGWDVSYTPTTSSASTNYQQPNVAIAPSVCAGDGSAVYNNVDYSAVYNYEYYKSHNADLQTAFGDNKQMYLSHFLLYGMGEGRQGCETFNLAEYKRRNPDLISAFGSDNRSYYLHYITYGYSEGRVANAQSLEPNLSYTICVGNAANVTLTARWIKRDFTLTFDTNRPTNPLSCHEPYCNESGRTIRYGQKYGTCVIDKNVYAKSLPVPTLEGYRFDGWYTEKIGGTKVDDNTIYNINGNSTLYAHWSDITAPGTNPGYVTITSATEEWVNHDVLVTSKAKDTGSGIKMVSTINSEKNGLLQTINNISATKNYPQATESADLYYTETREGLYQYYATANDYVGNTSQSVNKAYVKIDKTAPVADGVTLHFDKKGGAYKLDVDGINDNGSGLSDNAVSKLNHLWIEIHPGTDPNSANFTRYDIVNNQNGVTGKNNYNFTFSDVINGGIYNLYPNEEKLTIIVKATDVAGNISTVRNNASYTGDASNPDAPWLYKQTIDNCWLYASIDRVLGNNGVETSGIPNTFKQGEMGKLHIYVLGNMQHIKIDFPAEFEEGLATQKLLNTTTNPDGSENLNYSDEITNRTLSKEFDIVPMPLEMLGYDKPYLGGVNNYVPYDGANGYSVFVSHGGDEGYDFFVPMDMDKNTAHPFTNGQEFTVTVTATKGSVVRKSTPKLIVNDNVQYHIQTRIRDPKSPINDEIFNADVAEGNKLN